MPENYLFIDYNFETLVKRLQERLRKKETWKDMYESSTGQMLIELFAYVGEMVLYYLERRAEECYLDTAKLKSSVLSLVKLINYKPRRKVSAKGYVRFYLDTAHSKNIYIPRYTVVETADGTKYLTIKDVVLLKGQTSMDVEVVQGELVERTMTGSGQEYQEYVIDEVDVEDKSLWVYVDGILWEQVDSFILSEPTDRHYTVVLQYDGTLLIRFGNGSRGAIPQSGSMILIRFVKTVGVNGNVYGTNMITKVSSVIFDEAGSPVEVKVTNDNPVVGGDDEESIEEIKYNAPRVFRTGDRAVTKDDFSALVESYPGVATASVWGEREEGSPNYNMFNWVRIAMILQGWGSPTTDFEEELVEFLRQKSILTVRYEFVSADILDVYVVLDLRVKKNYTLSLVQSAVEKLIESLFQLGLTTRLGISKRYSDIIAEIEQVEGVDYVYMDLRLRKELVLQGSNWVEKLTALPVEKNSIQLFVGDVQIGEDDGEGNIVAVSGSTYTVSGTVDYSLGDISVSISPAPSETVYVLYRQDAERDIVVNFNQICKLYGVEVKSVSFSS